MPEANRDTFLTTSPGKYIFSIYTAAVVLVKLPIWLVYYIPQFNRQCSKWTYKQAISVSLLKAILNCTSLIEKKTPVNLEPGPEKDQWTVVNPTDKDYYSGIVVQDAEIRPTQIGGTWYPRKPQMNETGLVVLHFHGGAYVVGDGRKKDTGFLAKNILKGIGAPFVFCPQYRLASNPGGRFPAALQDAITSYTYLVETMAIDPSRIVIGGDSAGGNLTLAFLRYLSDQSSDFPLKAPKCALLWSPWVHPMGHFDDPDAVKKSPHRHTDFVSPSFSYWGSGTFAPGPNSGIPRNNPYLGFVKQAFKVGCPVWLSAGSAEVLYPDLIRFYELFKKIPENKLELSIEENAPHDTILLGELIGFNATAASAAQKAGKFVKAL